MELKQLKAFKLVNPGDSIMLLIDFQKNILKMCKSNDEKLMIANVRALMRYATSLNMPVVVTTTHEERSKDPLIKDFEELLPEATAARIKRDGITNSWQDPAFRAAVETAAEGRKNVIIAGITNDVCTCYPAVQMADEGYNVIVVQEAGGSPSKLGEDAARAFWEIGGCRTIGVNGLMAELGRNLPDDKNPLPKIMAEEVLMKLEPGFKV